MSFPTIENLFSKPRLILLLIALVSAALIPFALKVKPQNSLEAIAVDIDPAYRALQEFQKAFGVSEETLAVSVQSQSSLLTRKGLASLEGLRSDLGNVSNVARVIGVTNLENFEVKEDRIDISPLVPKNFDLTQSQAQKLIDHPLYKPLFISEDGKTSLLVIYLKPLGKQEEIRVQLIRDIDGIIAKHQQGQFKLLVTGTTYLVRESNRQIEKDNLVILPMAMSLLLGLLYYLYRRFSFVILPFIITGLTVLWVFGVMGILGIDLTIFTALVPLFLLTICLCDATHILNAVWRESIESHSQAAWKTVVILGVKRVLLASVLACLDNVIGFFTFMTSDMEAIRHIGFLTAIGVLFGFLLSVSIVPIALLYSKPRKSGLETRHFIFWTRLMRRLGTNVLNRPLTYLALGALILILSAWGVTRIEIGQDSWGMFKKKTAMEEANNVFKQSGTGASGEANVLLKGPTGFFFRPETINAMRQVERNLGQGTFSRKTYSLADAVAWIAGKYDSLEPLTENDVRSGLALLDFFKNTFFSKSEYVTADGSRYRIKQFVTFADNTAQVARFEQEQKTSIEAKLPEGAVYEVTARPYIWAHMIDYVVNSQIRNFLWAFLVISIVMGLIFRSFRIGLMTMVVNSLPILIAMGVIGWIGIRLNAFLAMVACVALGLAVDDTIHFIMHYREKLAHGLSPKEALLSGYESVGFQMFFATTLMALGTATFAFSGLTTTTQFGLLFSATCVLSLLAVLFLLPPMLLVFGPNIRRKI